MSGATGFIGSRLIPRLVKEDHEITILVRSTSNISALPKSVIVKECDLFDLESLEKAAQGMEALIHLAAYLDFYPSDKDLMFRVNVEGTRNIMNACVGTSVERIIYLSSTETIGAVRYPPGNEDTELNPLFDYGQSKLLAENVIRQISEDTGLPYVILRATGTIGPGDLYLGYEIIKAFNDGDIFALPGDGEKRINFTDVDDVVTGILLALTSKAALNETIILASDTANTVNEIAEFVGRHLGVEPPKRRIPTGLAKLGTAILSPIKNRAKTTFMWHMKTVQAFDEHRWYTNEKAKRILGWQPKYTFEESAKRAIDWYFENGYIERKS